MVSERMKHLLANPKKKQNGPGCSTCKLRDIEGINEDCQAWIESVKNDSGIAIGALLEILAEEYNYPFKKNALKSHIRGCLGFKED